MPEKSTSALTSPASPPPLRAVRIAHGLSLRETARRARIDPAHLSRVERGEKQLSLEALGRLADVLSLPELAKLLAPYRASL
jgi:transcriptional regulator with XRE-family HTH domain